MQLDSGETKKLKNLVTLIAHESGFLIIDPFSWL